MRGEGALNSRRQLENTCGGLGRVSRKLRNTGKKDQIPSPKKQEMVLWCCKQQEESMAAKTENRHFAN